MGHENFCKIVNGTPVEEPAWKSCMEFPMRKIEGRRRQESDSRKMFSRRASISWKKWFGVRKGWSYYRDIWFELWSFENFLEIYLFIFFFFYEDLWRFCKGKEKEYFCRRIRRIFFFLVWTKRFTRDLVCKETFKEYLCYLLVKKCCNIMNLYFYAISTTSRCKIYDTCAWFLGNIYFIQKIVGVLIK